jgi:hypothetical protein
VREHRVEVDHLRRLALPVAHHLDGVALEQLHARHDRRHVEIFRRPRQTILQQRTDQRLALDQAHLATQAGQHERVLAQPRRGVQHPWAHALGDANRLGDHLPAAAAVQTPVRRAALDKVHPHRSRRIRAELLQLQTLLADLQGELAVGHLQRQAQALGPLLGLRFKRRAEGLDMDAAGRGLLNHENTLKKLRIGKKWPINQSTRILPELSVDRKNVRHSSHIDWLHFAQGRLQPS